MTINNIPRLSTKADYRIPFGGKTLSRDMTVAPLAVRPEGLSLGTIAPERRFPFPPSKARFSAFEPVKRAKKAKTKKEGAEEK